MKDNLIITIGREYGSGGKEVGQLLAEKLNIKCYDKEILMESAKEIGFTTTVFEENDEKPVYSLLYNLSLGIGTANIISDYKPMATTLFIEQFKAIKKLADKGSCIFIGRCSDYVLKDRSNVINLFFHSSTEKRCKCISERLNISNEKALQQLTKKDKNRASYYKYYTEQRWGDAKNYNLSVDTSIVGIEGAVNIVLKYIEELN